MNNDVVDNDLAGQEPEALEPVPNLPGIIAILGELKPGAVITEEGMTHLFQRHTASIKRAVQRGELPPPVRMFGCNAWTVGVLVRHIEYRLNEAAKDAKGLAQKIATLAP